MLEQKARPPKPIWAYSYQIDPPQPESRLRAVRALLQHECTDAKAQGRVWEGRVMREHVVTHILVVADSPAQNRAVNGKLAAALKAIGAEISVTAPLAVADDPSVPSPA